MSAGCMFGSRSTAGLIATILRRWLQLELRSSSPERLSLVHPTRRRPFAICVVRRFSGCRFGLFSAVATPGKAQNTIPGHRFVVMEQTGREKKESDRSSSFLAADVFLEV